MAEVEYAEGLYRQVQAACALLESERECPTRRRDHTKPHSPGERPLQLPSPESDDARQMARNSGAYYWGITYYIRNRYPERDSIILGHSGGESSKRLALHLTALLSNCIIWDNILTVREFIHGQAAGHPPDPETFNSLVQQANATLLAAESDVELYLALQLVYPLNSYRFSPDLLRLKRKIRSRLKYRLYNRGRKQWTDAFRQRLFATQGKACAGCGAKFNSHSSMALDHIESPIMGGSDAPGNLQFLCHPCNGTKNVWGMWHLKQCLTEENRLIDSDGAEQAHQAALTFVV